MPKFARADVEALQGAIEAITTVLAKNDKLTTGEWLELVGLVWRLTETLERHGVRF